MALQSALPLPVDIIPDLPLPNLSILQTESLPLSPLVPVRHPFLSLVARCAAVITKEKITVEHGLLPPAIRKLFVESLESSHKQLPTDEALSILWSSDKTTLDFAKYRYALPRTILSSIQNSRLTLQRLILDQIRLDHVTLVSNIYFPQLRSLSMNHSSIPEVLVKQILEGSPKLISLSLEHCRNLDMKIITEIIEMACPKLLSFNLSNNCFIPGSTLATALSKLSLSRLLLNKSSSWLTNSVLQEIIFNSPSLKILQVNDMFSLNDSSVEKIIDSCPSIRHLSFVNCWNISDASLETLSKCQSLEELILDGCCLLSDEGLQHTKSLSHSLRNLSLRDCEGITSDGFDFILLHCPLLQHVDLQDNSSLQVARNCKNLRTLSLTGNHSTFRVPVIKELKSNGCLIDCVTIRDNYYLTTPCIIEIAKSWPSLKSITLQNATRLGDQALFAITKYCSNIESLDVSGCYFSKKTFLSFAKNATQLRSLNVSGCRKFNDDCLTTFAVNCPLLSTVDVSGCKKVTSTGISLFAAQCINLSSFCCSKVEESCIFALSKGLLRTLHITDGKLLSDQSLEQLASLSTLKFFQIVHGDTISDEGISKLVKGCLNLEELILMNCPHVTARCLSDLLNSSCDSIILSHCSVSEQEAVNCKGYSERLQILSPSGL